MKIEENQKVNSNIVIREHNIAKINNINPFKSPSRNGVAKDSMKITSYVSSRKIPFNLKLQRINKGKILRISNIRQSQLRKTQNGMNTISVEPQIDDLLRLKDNIVFNVK